VVRGRNDLPGTAEGHGVESPCRKDKKIN